MMFFKNIALVSLAIVLAPNVAKACHRNEDTSRVIYSQDFSGGERGKATVVYTVIAHVAACESGSASKANPFGGWHPIDTRNCNFTSDNRFLVRTIISKRPGKVDASLGEERVALSSIPEHSDLNCNDAINSNWAAFLDKTLGTKQNMQDLIDKDKDEVRNILELIGIAT